MKHAGAAKYNEFLLVINKLTKLKIIERMEIHPITGCWEWARIKREDGYGRIKIEIWDRNLKDEIHFTWLRAHRASWILFNDKPIPKGFLVCHKCNNPSCVNPRHLYVGTDSDNMKDMVAAGNHHRQNTSKKFRAKILKSQ